MSLTLGRFELLEPIAHGGMATVWRAHHVDQRVPVAVKVVRPGSRTSTSTHALRNEIRAMAALDHPNIVAIFDHGTVDAETAARSQGLLGDGSPWVALEYVEGDTLASLYNVLNWSVLRSTLLQLLSALSHAHSHGVIHRDLKLANILVSTGEACIKLTDFGIAYAMRHGNQAANAGTPRYMAPEQLDGRVAAQGPWTDLYALGVMAWRMATGAMPFPEEAAALDHAKRVGALLPYYPRFPVPAGFPGWLARLIEPRPSARFQSAADARWALLQLNDTLIEAPTGPTVPMADRSLPPPMPVVKPHAVPAPVPETWRSPHEWRRPAELIGCGLGLLALRGQAVVGRIPERDALWSELKALHRSGRARAVVLIGPSGVGKTSLAAWLTRKAEEIGGAIALRTRCAEPDGGLAGLLRNHLRCTGLAPEAIRDHLEDHLHGHAGVHPDEAARLQELIAPSGSAPVPADERLALCTRELRRLTRLRPGVVHLDDAHGSIEVLDYTARLLEDPHAPVVLSVLTIQEEALALDPDAQHALEHLIDGGAQVLRVRALPLDDHIELVQGMLPLDPSLARQVAVRTEGNPLFASQLLEDWAARGALQLGPSGFRLRSAVPVSLPTSLADVWQKRVESMLDATLHRDRVPLELAAVLGSQVNRQEWQAITERFGWTDVQRIEDALYRHRLADRDKHGFRFVHAMLREAILEEARSRGRLAWHHAAVTGVLQERGADPVRIAMHLVHSAPNSESLPELDRGIALATARGDSVSAWTLLQARYNILESESVPGNDPRWGEGVMAEIELMIRLERWNEAAERAEAMVALARANGWHEVEVRAIILLVEHRATDAAQARSYLQRARQVALRHKHTMAPLSVLASEIARRQGDLRRAVIYAEEAVTYARTHGGERVSRCELTLARALMRSGKAEQAAVHLNRALEHAREAHQPFDLAVGVYLQGCLVRDRGDLDAAATSFQEATDRFSALGDGNAWSMRAHLGLILARQGRDDVAMELFDTVLRAPSVLGHLLAHLGSMMVRADDVDQAQFAEHLAALDRYLAKGWCDPLAAEVTEMAAERAETSGFTERATTLKRLARSQRQRLAVGTR